MENLVPSQVEVSSLVKRLATHQPRVLSQVAALRLRLLPLRLVLQLRAQLRAQLRLLLRAQLRLLPGAQRSHLQDLQPLLHQEDPAQAPVDLLLEVLLLRPVDLLRELRRLPRPKLPVLVLAEIRRQGLPVRQQLPHLEVLLTAQPVHQPQVPPLLRLLHPQVIQLKAPLLLRLLLQLKALQFLLPLQTALEWSILKL